MFPIISHIDDLLPYIRNKPEITIKAQPNGTTTVCYAIAGPSTFDDEYARECRGITFGSDGKIICRPLHKFFNIGERPETQVGSVDWTQVERVMDKRDGSMITSMLLDGHIVCKTKKSFETDQATRANKFINDNANFHQFAMYCASINCTPTFEWTSPNDRIVLKYNHDELVLTHIRDNISGEYVLDVEARASYFKIPVVDDLTPFSFDIKWLMNKNKDEELKEGYVIQFKNGDMVKLKTPWYISLHHSVTFTRERDIAKMVVDETLDDFKSYLSSIGESLDKVHAIENRVLETVNGIRKIVEDFVKVHHHDDRKTFVETAKTSPLFSLIMKHYMGAEPPYNEHFIKYYLKDYTLETV
jgi:RNA ligase